MSTLVVVQARMGSTRLPGKVAADVHGRPLLALMLQRLRPLEVDHLVVATSSGSGDDRVAEVAGDAGVAVVRGSEQDVLGRFADALDRHPADVVVRLTADCPLADPEVVAQAVARHAELGVDYLSNTLVRTYPDGLDVEVVAADALRRAIREATDPAEREHVTPHVYRRPRRFRLAQLTTPERAGDERWTIDTPDDLAWLRAAVAADPARAELGWRDLLAELGRRAAPPSGAMTLEPDIDLVDHPAGQPFRRRWRAVRESATIGAVELEVDDGRGRWRTDAPTEERADVAEALVQALRADAQVVELEAA